MEATIYFLVWAVIIFLMMRYGCGAHVTGHAHGHSEKAGGREGGEGAAFRWIPPATDIDPVCGMTVSTKDARSSVHGGLVYYFCSNDCRERFERSPEAYLKKKPAQPATAENSHA